MYFERKAEREPQRHLGDLHVSVGNFARLGTCVGAGARAGAGVCSLARIAACMRCFRTSCAETQRKGMPVPTAAATYARADGTASRPPTPAYSGHTARGWGRAMGSRRANVALTARPLMI